MAIISPKRKRILDFITGFIEDKGYPPSIRDIASGCSISSPSVAQYYVTALERDGYISRRREISRSISLTKKQTTQGVPLLGTIAAGLPIPVPESDTWVAAPEEILDVPEYLTGGMINIYAVRVKGKSMIDALIDDGDIIVMQATNSVENGAMAAVWLKDRQEVTLKKFYREAGRIRLQPANTTMQPIYCRPEDVEIQGKVIAVLRKIRP